MFPQEKEEDKSEWPSSPKLKNSPFASASNTFAYEFKVWKQRNKVPGRAKVYSICGGYEDLRRSLRWRGWIENPDPHSQFFDLRWTVKARDVHHKSLKPHQIVNHFSQVAGCITTKAGLLASLTNELRWFTDMDHTVFFPRCYDLNNPSEFAAFVTDFRWCAAESVLKKAEHDSGLTPNGVPSMEYVNIALKVAEHRLRHLTPLVVEAGEGEGEASEAPELPALTDQQWCRLLSCPAFDPRVEGVPGQNSFPRFTSRQASTTAEEMSSEETEETERRGGGLEGLTQPAKQEESSSSGERNSSRGIASCESNLGVDEDSRSGNSMDRGDGGSSGASGTGAGAEEADLSVASGDENAEGDVELDDTLDDDPDGEALVDLEDGDGEDNPVDPEGNPEADLEVDPEVDPEGNPEMDLEDGNGDGGGRVDPEDDPEMDLEDGDGEWDGKGDDQDDPEGDADAGSDAFIEGAVEEEAEETMELDVESSASPAAGVMPIDSDVWRRIKAVLGGLEEHGGPQYPMDGSRNVWVLKPAGKSRGRGIRIFNKLDLIMHYIGEETPEDQFWVAQKYMENPLLIHNRKFDIRQWVLVTNWNPLTVWFYAECYIRFCAEDFTLSDLDNNFQHLSNNSIAKYSEQFQDMMIGEGNMWSMATFQQYLQQGTGSTSAWERVAREMRQHTVHTLSAAQGEVMNRQGSCELFGFDYCVDDDFKVWLIEVNCSPSLEHSTPVTSRLVAAVMQDTAKVIIDLPLERLRRKKETNPPQPESLLLEEFDTGMWECIYRNTVTVPRPMNSVNGAQKLAECCLNVV
jgi:tubulin monoglycylase TTLL3/8